MNALYLGPVPPLPGGIAQHGGRLVDALRKAGHEIGIVSWRAQYPKRLYRGASLRPSHPKFTLSWWNPLATWRTGVKARGLDLVIIPWVGPFQAFHYQILFWALRGQARVVVVVHNVLPHERFPLQGNLTRRILGRADGWIVHAEAVAAQLRTLVPAAEPVTVPMPANLPVTATPLPGYPPYRLLFFGTVRAYKGLDLAVDALELLLDRGIDASLTVAGEFWTPVEEIESEYRKRGLTNAVHLQAGYIPDDAVADLFSAHHVLIAPYRDGSQSGVVSLGLAAGRPTVVTNVGGLAELVDEGRTGAVAETVDPNGVAAAIERVLARLDEFRAPTGRDFAGSWEMVAEAVVRAGG